jgi:transcriptional regulator with XRE-family HTH domain
VKNSTDGAVGRSRTWVIRDGPDLGRTVAEIRRLRGWTQEALAANAGIERTYLAKLEAGASVRFLERALRALRRLGATVTVVVELDHAEK